MADNFSDFSKLVHAAFVRITANNPFVVDITGEAPAGWDEARPFVPAFQLYLSAFPEGSDPTFKKHSEHDCSCCRHFVKHAGVVVGLNENGSKVTVWDDAADRAPYPYNIVAAAMRDAVQAAPVTDLFRTNQKDISFGSEVTRSSDADGKVFTWRHFFSGPVPTTLRSATPDAVRGQLRTDRQTFERGLKEIKPEAIATILSIIDSGESALYKGREFRPALNYFQTAQNAYLSKEGEAREAFLWLKASSQSASFRGSSIGQLAVALSEPDADLQKEVAAYERFVAPENYKRTSALVTPGMIKKAMETITELNLEPALERRLARLSDISVNDVLWVDGRVKPLMKGGLGDMLMSHVAASASVADDEKRAEEIAIGAFLADVLPKATGMELFFKGSQQGNLVALTAPVHPEPAKLFKWDGDFAWTYTGNLTDSLIKERVKKAGGNVTNAKLRVSLSWTNHDDLDIHVIEPNGERICFHNKISRKTGGQLDVDMNAGGGTTRTPVENISWASTVPDGIYKVIVNNYALRERSAVGFIIEVENAGKVSHFSMSSNPKTNDSVEVVDLTVKDGIVVKMDAGKNVASSSISQEKWGVQTENYVKVNAVTYSPNFWNGQQVGNKHTLFLCEGVVADEPLRGIYNEFLDQRLEEHRKVFDLVGEKTKCVPTPDGLAGLGFSSTKRDSVLVRVTMADGKRQRLFNVQIG